MNLGKLGLKASVLKMAELDIQLLDTQSNIKNILRENLQSQAAILSKDSNNKYA